MTNPTLAADPYNLIITGVGGQGNVLASKIVGNMLVGKGFQVTIGETFGASQRGGSVMSHLRVSTKSMLSPQIPKGKGHLIMSLEPTEAVRVLNDYGNPDIKLVTNTRPVHSVGVIRGDDNYPSMDELKEWAEKLTAAAWFIDATDEAVKLGSPILGNVLLLGALAGVGDLPLSKAGFREVIDRSMHPDKVELNLKAYDMGLQMIQLVFQSDNRIT
jgi:indolepyruvate ferredoxin oxidoreductase beta subunit